MNIRELFRNLGCEIIAEVGVLRGDNAQAILETCPAVERLVLVDPWAMYVDLGQSTSADKPLLHRGRADWDETARIVYSRFLNAPKVSIVRLPSVAAAGLFPDASFDAVFIDADHSYEPVKADIAAWLPKVRSGGLLSGHDYTIRWPEVVQAVNEMFGSRVVEVGGCWTVEVP